MKKGILILTVIASFLATLSFSCSKKKTTEPSDVMNSSGSIGIYAQTNTGGLQLMAGLNEGTIQNGDFQVNLNPDVVQLLQVLDSSHNPILLKVASTDNGSQNIEIDAESTAEALLYMSPMFVTSDRDEYSLLISEIHALSSFTSLVGVIQQQLNANALSLDESNADLASALNLAYEELMLNLADSKLNNLRDYYPQMAVNGLELIDVDEEGDDIRFRMKNYAKRWISVYIDKSLDGTSTEMATSRECLIPSTDISIWSILQGLTGHGFFETSDEIVVQKGNYSKIEVNAYGLGINNMAFSELTDQEQDRVLLPAIYTSVFDIALPLVEVIIGVNFTAELRGRPNSTPIVALINTINVVLASGSNLEGIADAWATGSVTRVIMPIVNVALSTIINNPRYIRDIVNSCGHSFAASAFDHVFAPLRIIKLVINATNLLYGIASVIATEAITTFNFDIEAPATNDLTIHGVVLDATNNSPIPGCTVSVRNANNMLITYVETNQNGLYSFDCTEGTYRLRFTKNGYRVSDSSIAINHLTLTLPNVYLIPYQSGVGNVTGAFYDATNLNSLSGVNYSIRVGNLNESGLIVAQGTSGSNGTFSESDILSGVYTMYYSKNGYISGRTTFTITENHTSSIECNMSPDIQVDGYRIVLTWGGTERDLDSHLFTPSINGNTYHVYYGNMGSLTSPPYCALDVDDVSYYGPETISIGQVHPGIYSYSVYNYSNYSSITNSSAQVTLYGEDGFIGAWDVPNTGSGRWWDVFTIDGSTGEIQVINQIRNSKEGVYLEAKD